MPVLLRDIREVLWEIVLLLSGLALCTAGLPGVLRGVSIIAGVIIGIAGIAYAHNGYTQHRGVEKKTAENNKEDA